MRRVIVLAMLVALLSGRGWTEDLDVMGLRAKMAAQEALMNDLEAKMASRTANGGDNPEYITSMRRNASVTVGGLVTTGVYVMKAKVDSAYALNDAGGYDRTGSMRRRADAKFTSTEILDSELHFDIQINDHVDAFVLLNLANGIESDYYLTKAYWVRWKNICDTGFGIKVGRDKLVFGDLESGVGSFFDSFAASGDGVSWLSGSFFDDYPGITGNGDGVLPLHNYYNMNGVTQVTPYWEGLDGKFKFELSFIQNVDNDGARNDVSVSGSNYYRDRDGTRRYRSRSYGSLSARVTYAPFEDLKLTAGFVNFRSNRWADDEGSYGNKRNNSAIALAFNYRPSFFSKLLVWGQWIHGWNVSNYDGLDSDVLNYGASFDVTEKLTLFMQGDYIRSRYKFDGMDNKGTAWAAYGGIMYTLPYDVLLEMGWRHESITYKESGVKTGKIKSDTLYGLVSYEF